MITLVPKGGLGNRINAICSAMVYCRQKQRKLKIMWFTDPGLNCSYKELFSLNPAFKNVTIQNGNLLDMIYRDQPRKRNLRLPDYFSKYFYDKCIYWYKGFEVKNNKEPYDDELEKYRKILLVICGPFWESTDMWNCIVPAPAIIEKAKKIRGALPKNTIGIHIRRTDNIHIIKCSPTYLFIDKIKEELAADPEAHFFLASDSMEEKDKLTKMFGSHITTPAIDADRNSKDGIFQGFVEMNVLARCTKIYAGHSTFAEVAANLGHIPFIKLEKGINNE
ncbi:MAG: hypothetical protein WCR45_04190 [Bacteroidaceae bacterium]|nr:hypothetical protein [Bacteroidaceae bacterium]